MIPYTITVMGSCLTDGAQAGLHALSAARRSMRSMIFTSALYLGLGIAGAYLDGAAGTVWGAAIATWVGATLWWTQLNTALQEYAARSSRAAGRHRKPGQLLSEPQSRPAIQPSPGEASVVMDPG